MVITYDILYPMDALTEFLKRRANSTFLVSYTVFWMMYHWEGFVVIFTVSQEYIMSQYGILKNEYLAKYFFGLMQLEDWSWGIFAWKILGFIMPAALAFIYVWWLPKWILNPCYKKEIYYKIERKIIKNKEEKRLNESETKKVESEIELSQKQEEAQSLNPEEAWQTELDDFLSTNSPLWLDTLSQLKEVIYYNSGSLRNSNGRSIMTSDELMLCDTNGLIKINVDAQGRNIGRISLTDKGKFFLRESSRNSGQEK